MVPTRINVQAATERYSGTIERKPREHKICPRYSTKSERMKDVSKNVGVSSSNLETSVAEKIDAESQSPEETERLLFGLLKSRGIVSTWATTSTPRAALVLECQQLLEDTDFRDRLNTYLSNNPVIAESMETVLAQLAFSSGVHWKHAQPILQPLAHRGQHLARWLPTFLLVDGPLGRLLRQASSPLVEKLRSIPTAFPLLSSSRNAFNNDLFRKVRNGFAHWSFVWKNVGGSVELQIFHYESGALEAKLSLLEAEALHFLSASIIQTLDEELLRKVVRP